MLLRLALVATLALGCERPSQSTGARRPAGAGPICAEQACLSACAKGDCAACTEVTPGLRSPSSPDARASVESIASACDAGCSSLCAPAGIAFAGLSDPPVAGVPLDRPRALGLFRRGCEAGSAPACNLTWYGGREAAPGTADALLVACEGGSPNACGNLGAMYIKGDGVPHNDARGAELLKRGCDAGDIRSCSSLGLAVLNGRGVAADPTRAAAILRHACDAHDAASCGNLGALYANGVGTAKDLAKAEKMMRVGCEGGDRLSCKNLTLLPRR